MTHKFTVQKYGKSHTIGDTPTRVVTIELQTEEGELELTIPETEVSRMMEKLKGLGLAPSGMQPPVEL